MLKISKKRWETVRNIGKNWENLRKIEINWKKFKKNEKESRKLEKKLRFGGESIKNGDLAEDIWIYDDKW